MQPDDEVVLIVSPADSTPLFSVVPGSESIRATCGHAAYLSPQGKAVLQQNPSAITRCLDCTDANEVLSQQNISVVPGGVDAAARMLHADPHELEQRFHEAIRRHGGSYVPTSTDR